MVCLASNAVIFGGIVLHHRVSFLSDAKFLKLLISYSQYLFIRNDLITNNPLDFESLLERERQPKKDTFEQVDRLE